MTSLVTKPVIVSHTGVQGVCDNNRNLSDDQLRAVAATGGVIGVGFWDVAGAEPTQHQSPRPSAIPLAWWVLKMSDLALISTEP